MWATAGSQILCVFKPGILYKDGIGLESYCYICPPFNITVSLRKCHAVTNFWVALRYSIFWRSGSWRRTKSCAMAQYTGNHCKFNCTASFHAETHTCCRGPQRITKFARVANRVEIPWKLNWLIKTMLELFPTWYQLAYWQRINANGGAPNDLFS